jgi:hypothetical protein
VSLVELGGIPRLGLLRQGKTRTNTWRRGAPNALKGIRVKGRASLEGTQDRNFESGRLGISKNGEEIEDI